MDPRDRRADSELRANSRVAEVYESGAPAYRWFGWAVIAIALPLSIALALTFWHAKVLEVELLHQARTDLAKSEAALKVCNARSGASVPTNSKIDPVSSSREIPSQQLILILLLQKLDKEVAADKDRSTGTKSGASGSSSNVFDVLKSLTDAVSSFMKLGLLGAEQGKTLISELEKKALEVGGTLTLELGRAIIAELFANEAKKDPSSSGFTSLQVANQTGLNINLTCQTPPVVRPIVVQKPPPTSKGCLCTPKDTSPCPCSKASD